MLINFREVKRKGYPYIDRGMHFYLYHIEDDNFSEQWVGVADQWLYYAEVRPNAIINCYLHKKEDPAFHLYCYHMLMKTKFSWYDLDREINYCVQHALGYSQYEAEVRDLINRHDSLKAFQ